MPDPFIWRSRIRFSETDASGRIHYAAMFRHMEAAEDEFMRSISLEYSKTMADGELAFPRVHVEAQFMAALHYDDEIETHVLVERVGESSFTLYFKTVCNEVAVARGRITSVCISVDSQRPHAIPEAMADALRENRR